MVEHYLSELLFNNWKFVEQYISKLQIVVELIDGLILTQVLTQVLHFQSFIKNKSRFT